MKVKLQSFVIASTVNHEQKNTCSTMRYNSYFNYIKFSKFSFIYHFIRKAA